MITNCSELLSLHWRFLFSFCDVFLYRYFFYICIKKYICWSLFIHSWSNIHLWLYNSCYSKFFVYFPLMLLNTFLLHNKKNVGCYFPVFYPSMFLKYLITVVIVCFGNVSWNYSVTPLKKARVWLIYPIKFCSETIKRYFYRFFFYTNSSPTFKRRASIYKNCKSYSNHVVFRVWEFFL